MAVICLQEQGGIYDVVQPIFYYICIVQRTGMDL